MRKRFLSVLITVLCVLALTSSAAFLTSAGDVDTTSLIEAIANAPAPALWEDYIDTSKLEQCLEYANVMLADENITQSSVEYWAEQINLAVAGLKLHTKGIVLNTSSLTLPVGGQASLTATLSPEGAADGVNFGSSLPTAVSVDKNGAVKVLRHTSATVTLTAESNGHIAICEIKTTNPLASVKMASPTASVYKTRSVQLTAKPYGIDSTAISTDAVSWIWRSSDTSVAKITSSGYVTGVSTGTCTITATATNGSVTYSDTCTLSVNDFIPVTTLQPITISSSTGLSVTAGETCIYRVGILPTNATDKSMTWTSTDTSVATVTPLETANSIANAAITAVKEGTAKIYFSASDGSGVYGSVTVNVAPQITKIVLDETVTVLNIGQTKQLGLTVTPSNAGNQTLTWQSSDDSVCSVDYKGNLTARKLGVCTITADTTDGSALQVRCNIRVASVASEVKISLSSLALDTGEGYRLTATATTVDSTTYTSYGEFLWSTSNAATATVSAYGYVYARQSGTAIITATAKDGSGVKGTCTVKVTSPVTGVSLPSSLTLGVTKTKTLSPVFAPAYATNKDVTWKSSNSAVASVSSAGTVTAKAVGTAKITCVTSDGGFTASCTVSVVIPVTSVSLNRPATKIYTGTRTALVATILPSNATNKTVTYKSSNPAVATVSSTGLVTAIKAGTAVITVTASDGGSYDTCTVTCIQKVKGVALGTASLTCYIGQVCALTVTISPSNATNKVTTFKSSVPTVASVNSEGVITAKKDGMTVITVTTADGGYTASCTVKVVSKIAVTSLSFGRYAANMTVGNYIYVKPVITPVDASEKGITYKSSNTAVAIVYSNGKIVARGPGYAVITGTTVDGGLTATCKVRVKQPVTGLELSAATRTMYVGKTVTLTAVVSPSNASNKAVKWSSDNKAVATVSSTGVVKAVSKGICTITGTTADGGFSSTCRVTVLKAVTGVKLSKSSVKISKGDKIMLTATVIPTDATVTDITWSSSNILVASVTSTGKVTTFLPGTATITCTTKSGGYKATCVVTVFQPVTSLTLNASSVKLDAGQTKTLTATVAPENASNTAVKWKSTDPSIATIDSKGKITAVSKGTARIVASSADGYCSAYCSVSVTQPPTSVTVSPKTKKLNVGSSATLSATVLPINAYDRTVRWYSSNTAVATVSQTGTVKAIKAGSVTITCVTNSGNVRSSCSLICKIPPQSVSLSRKSMTLYVGKSSTLTANVLPTNATYKEVTWSSSNPSVVKINSAGTLTAVAIGSVTITAKTKDGGYTATCFVTVPQRVTGVTLSRTGVTMVTGQAIQLRASVKPVDATFDSVSWSSSNPYVASVSSSGKVTAKSIGSAYITVRTSDGGYTKICRINVIRSVTSVTLNREVGSLYIGRKLTLIASVAPSNATYTGVKWYSSNTAVATVDANGCVTAKSPGKAVITVKTDNRGLTDTCTITVARIVTGVKLNQTSARLYVGRAVTLTPTISPSNATNKAVKWTSSNTAVAKVSSSGVVTAVAKGTATITCTTASAKKTAVCTVTVLQQVTGVKLSLSSKSVYINGRFTLSATVLPSNANYKSVRWSSSNTAVATVDSAGRVTAKGYGTAVITVKTVNCSKTATCTVTVVRPVTGVRLNASSYTATLGKNFTLSATVLPTNATYRTVSWTSSDTSVLTVSSSGIVTPVGLGKATVTCTTRSGGKTAVCTITVKPAAAETVVLDKTSLTLSLGETYSFSAYVLPAICEQTISWMSGDSSVVSVSSAGVITAMGEGTAVISATSYDGKAVATCTVTVSVPVAEDEVL